MGKKRVAELNGEVQEKTEALVEKKAVKEEVVKKIKKETRKRSKSYQKAKKQVDLKKLYPLSEAIKLLKSISLSQFKGNVDVHLNVKEVGLKGEIQFPYPTGKKQNIRIADEKLLAELEKNKIDFTLLVATPVMMGKLMKFAKLLGPRGLMPNPKNGTVTEKPQEFIKNQTGKTQFKTEPKFPLIHLSLGKIDAPEKELAENFKALVKAVGRRYIFKAVLAPTMGPGIKIDLSSINN